MKIAVNLTVELDPKDWDCGELANAPTRLRNDVRSHVLNSVRQLGLITEADATVEIQRNK